ncbi:hypothetical protein KIW84_071440 [Lathyrus oleraceus]|uniref:Uncharacterized protein n=1 Tax=Pisum sativum TaxID=3888 RepID=A0A9D4ZW11_PEA|nr:hypothetical protein KIW84_071440 [Pisum sativum]
MLKAERFKDNIIITLPANGHRMEIGITHEPESEEKALSNVTTNKILWESLLGCLVLLIPSIVAFMYFMDRPDRSQQTSTPVTATIAAPTSPYRSILRVSPRELKVGTSDNRASSPENIRCSFNRVMSASTFDDTEVNNIGLKISDSPGDLTKSPTTRSSHAYDGSASSNDGTDERSLDHNLCSFEGGSRKGKSIVNNQMQYQNEMLETTRHDHAHRMRTKKDEFPFKMPLRGNVSQSGYESGSPSNQIYDELYLSSSYVSPDSVEDPDQEKMKLLRMVYKLQDQLNRTRETYERPSAVKRISSYQSHDSHDRRFYHDSVSYSDDYGHSASKSYSSEGDHVSVAPFHHLRGGARGNPRVSPLPLKL